MPDRPHTPEPYYTDERVTLFHGDALDVLSTVAAGSFDACVTDPPYDLTAGKRGGAGAASVNLDSRSRIGTGNGAGGFMGQAWDATGVAFDPDTWRLVLRALKPGGHVLAFGGSRTWHRLACAVEDAGFEVRDSIAWLYGSGFPKSMDVSKAIDKAAGAVRQAGPVDPARAARLINQAGDYSTEAGWSAGSRKVTVDPPATPEAEQWQGWGTALKPAFEPIVVARKPLVGTVSANVLAYGTGALNIDGCRIGTEERLQGSTVRHDIRGGNYGAGHRTADDLPAYEQNVAGRWPANVVLDESQAVALDEQSGFSVTPSTVTRGASLSGKDGATARSGGAMERREGVPCHGDMGGASRFFYIAKADSAERPRVNGIAHPTVKPLDLMRWLVRLVTPPGGTVLEPFAGSGTTVEACLLEGFTCVAVEREEQYLPLIQQRIDRRHDPVAAVRRASDDAGLFDLLDGEGA